jgi:uncharacterized protein DUF5985
MAEAIYALCAITSVACAALLIRGFVRTRARILLWSSLCFAGLALNNALLIVDLVILPNVDLSIERGVAALAGLAPLVFGLIWES